MAPAKISSSANVVAAGESRPAVRFVVVRRLGTCDHVLRRLREPMQRVADFDARRERRGGRGCVPSRGEIGAHLIRSTR